MNARVLIMLVISGAFCLPLAQADLVPLGATRAEVIAAMGEPQGTFVEETSELLIYKGIDIQLENGRVSKVNDPNGSLLGPPTGPVNPAAPAVRPPTPPSPPTASPDPVSDAVALAPARPVPPPPPVQVQADESQNGQTLASQWAAGKRAPMTTGAKVRVAAGIVVALIGLAVAVGAGVWLLVRAFTVHLGWGFACMFLPVAQLVFLIMHWQEGGKPFLVSLAGTAVTGLGMYVAFSAIVA